MSPNEIHSLFFIFFWQIQTGGSPQCDHLRRCLLSPHLKNKFIWDFFLKWNGTWANAQTLYEIPTLYKKTEDQISSIITLYKGNHNLDFVPLVTEQQRGIRSILYVFYALFYIFEVPYCLIIMLLLRWNSFLKSACNYLSALVSLP